MGMGLVSGSLVCHLGLNKLDKINYVIAGY